MKASYSSYSFNSFCGVARQLSVLLGLVLAAATPAHVNAQGQLPSGTVGGTGSGPYTYSLSFSDTAGATSPVGSVWYAWTPGNFYLPAMPLTASAPAGWTGNISANSIQFTANNSGFDILPGQTLAGFGYTASFTPAQLAAAPNSGLSDAYSGALFSDGGVEFTVLAVVPEPSTTAMAVLGIGALALVWRRSQKAA